MATKPLKTTSDPAAMLDSVMRKVSLIISLLALGLMVGGVIETLLSGVSLTVATAAIPMSVLRHITQAPPGLAAMSVGIILLALLPGVRVVLALCLYIRHRKLGGTLVALVVLLELLLSMQLEG